MAKEDRNALAISSRGEDSQGSTTQALAAAAGPPGGGAGLCDKEPSANSTDGERSADEMSEGHLPAPHLVGVHEEEFRPK